MTFPWLITRVVTPSPTPLVGDLAPRGRARVQLEMDADTADLVRVYLVSAAARSTSPSSDTVREIAHALYSVLPERD